MWFIIIDTAINKWSTDLYTINEILQFFLGETQKSQNPHYLWITYSFQIIAWEIYRKARSYCLRAAGSHRLLLLDKPVDVVLGAVLRRRHLEHVRDAQQGLARVAVCDHLKG